MAIKDLKWNPPVGGNAGYWSGTFIVDNTGDSIDTFRLPIGNTTGDITVKLDGIDENLFPGAEKSINVIDCYSFNLTSSSPTVTEGGTVTLNLTTDAPDGDYTFNITGTGIVGDELSGGGVTWDGTSKYTGVFTKSGGTVAPITLSVLTDADTVSDDFTVQLDNGKATPITVTINELVQTWSLSATPPTVTEGNPVTITLTTTNVDNGSIPFSIRGATRSGHIQQTGGVTWDDASSEYKGNFDLSGNTASITLNTLDDGIADGPLTLTLSLDNGESSVIFTVSDPAAPATCGSGISNSLTTLGTGNISNGNNISIDGFENGGIFHYPDFGGSVFPGNSVVFKVGNTGILGLLSYTTNLANSAVDTVAYETVGGACYQANLSDPVDGDGAVVLNLV